MDQPAAILKYIEAGHPDVLIVASQIAITTSNHNEHSRGSGNQVRDQQKKKDFSNKATVNKEPATVPSLV
jgi:hypothetical protein